MSERSYAQITWSRKRLALGMVNPHGQYFALYAEPLIRLFKKPDEYALVKKMDRHPERARTYHGGEIWAVLVDEGAMWRIQLIFGQLNKRLQVGRDGGVLEWLTLQDYYFPKDELETFGKCLSTMLVQMRDFERLKMEAETRVDQIADQSYP